MFVREGVCRPIATVAPCCWYVCACVFAKVHMFVRVGVCMDVCGCASVHAACCWYTV